MMLKFLKPTAKKQFQRRTPTFIYYSEARLLLALAAANGDKVIKTDTKQAYLYGDMGDDVVYIRPGGGQSLFQRDTSCSYLKAFMEPMQNFISEEAWRSSIIMLGYDVEIVFSPLASKISTSYPNIC